jgi:hypothetical protein
VLVHRRAVGVVQAQQVDERKREVTVPGPVVRRDRGREVDEDPAGVPLREERDRAVADGDGVRAEGGAAELDAGVGL